MAVEPERSEPANDDAARIEELTEIIQTVRDRVRSRYPRPQDAETADAAAIRIPLADLMPLVHARDAAQAKIAAIGSVNPRAGGPLNSIIQFVKKTISRSLGWFVRDQVIFNRETVAALESVIEALNDHNRILGSLAAQTNEQVAYLRGELTARSLELSKQIDVRAVELSAALESHAAEIYARVEPVVAQVDLLKEETIELKDIRTHWIEWRADWEQRLSTNEIQFLRSVADLQGAFQHRVTMMETGFRDIVKSQHTDYLGALDRATFDIQQRLWRDLEKVRGEYERLIHTELRIIRQRGLLSPVSASPTPLAPSAARATATPMDLDYGRFAERFRGPEDDVRQKLAFYKPKFANCDNVLDIGCGRGEFLETMRELNIRARGIDLSEESVAQCRAKGLNAETADLFAFLESQPEGEFDGIMSSQVVEHLPPETLPRMIRLCAEKLRRGGVLAIETPNPECLAIFATHFYLDPTHTRPVPHPLLAFYMQEAGFETELQRLSPAAETIPEIAELPPGFREKFFDGLDYAMIGRRL